jgi:hypothetical protein
MTRFRQKYLYTVQLGYRVDDNPRINNHRFSVVVSTKTVEKASEKATEVMKVWPGIRNGKVTEVILYSVELMTTTEVY